MFRLTKYAAVLILLCHLLAWAQSEPAKNDATSATPAQPADSTALEPIVKEQPAFPKEAMEHGIQGQVVLHLSINEAGEVEQVEVISGHPVLAKAAVDAAKNWKYKPYIKNGHPVRVSAKIPLNFALPTGPQPGDSTALEPIKADQAIFPLDAINQEIQGRVWIKIQVSETGDVERVDIVSGEPVLARSAVNAAKNWKFKPFIKNGKPIKVEASVPLDFTFENKIMKNGVAADGSATNDKHKSVAAGYPSTPINAVPSAADNGQSQAALPERVRVSQGVTRGLLIHQVAPVYPEQARTLRIQGKVLFQAVIGKDGNIHDLQVLSGPKELVRAAADAVEQWRYRPYLLQGHPVEVDTTIEINFTLQY